ncbi:tetratricopeptide repeat protein [Nitrosophilus alvini]|uniref:tetratricopeptide repeat protein n=1 Tax=Nitrosophilus alvini TaxID=2714855 RepID=UPI00190BA534|nr:tetratricopeptide repeat protein [Nitrosophilus alvini]
MKLKKIWPIFLLIVSLYGYDDFIKKAYYDSYNYEKMGDFEDAIKSLMPVYKQYPNAYTPNLRLGWLFYLEKKYSNALFHYEKAALAVKSAIKPKLGIINIYMLQQKYEDAIKLCNDILKMDYYNYYANLYFAQILIYKKEFSNAKAVIYKMLSLYPSEVLFLEKLASIFEHENRKEEAAKIYEDILILDPKNIAANEFFQRNGKAK